MIVGAVLGGAGITGKTDRMFTGEGGWSVEGMIKGMEPGDGERGPETQKRMELIQRFERAEAWERSCDAISDRGEVKYRTAVEYVREEYGGEANEMT
eukprot:jgi/Psemu1/38180/gm1.38180_g